MSIEEDVELIRAVREWKQPDELHPIAIYAWDVYEVAGLQMTDDGVEVLRVRLNGYGDDLAGLAMAMEGLIRFILCMRQLREDEPAAQKVVDLLKEYAHLYEPFWERVAEAMSNVGEDTKTLFSKMQGEEPPPKDAPVFDAKPPDGSIPLKKLVTPGRPPAYRPPGKKR